MAGTVAPHKALQKLLCGDVQRLAGGIFHRDIHRVLRFRQVKISACVPLRVFRDVHNEVFQNPPQQRAVRKDERRLAGFVQDRLNPRRCHAIGVLAHKLFEQLHGVDGLQMHIHSAAHSLGRLQDVLCELFQLCALFFQHIQILCTRLLIEPGLLEEGNIVDQRRKRRFQIMADICDELRLHTLTLHTLLHGARHAVSDAVQIRSQLAPSEAQLRQIGLVFQIAGGELLRRLPYLLFLAIVQQQQNHREKINNPQQHKYASRIADRGDINEDRMKDARCENDDPCRDVK